jgi:hypothetical protein
MSDSTADGCPRVDTRKTLAELTGVDWGPPPPEDRVAIVERHVTRRKRLADWTTRELVRFLCIIGGDDHILVPVAIERLGDDPIAASGSRPGELLSAVLESDGFGWTAHPECVRRVRDIVGRALGLIAEDEENALAAGWHVYRSWAIFERRLSSVP